MPNSANKIFSSLLGLIIILLPTYQIRFSIFSIPLTLLEVLILVIFTAWLIYSLSTKQTLKLPSFKISLILFVVAGLVSLIVAPELSKALGIWKAYLIEPILFYFVFINSVTSQALRKKIYYSLAILTSYIGLYAAFQYLTGFNIPNPWNTAIDYRAVSVFAYPNAVGLILAPIVAFLSGLVIWSKKIKKSEKIFFTVSLTLGILGILAAKTESALIALGAVIIVYLLFTKYRWLWLGSILIIIGASLFVPPVANFAESKIFFQDISGDVRLTLWQGSWNLLKDRPIFGAGLASFQEMYTDYKLTKHTEFLVYPHNIFLNWWIELGLLGLMALLSTLITYAKNIANLIRKKDPLAISLLGVLVTIIICGLVDVPYFKNDLALLFWLWLGLNTLLYLNKKNSQG